MINLRRLWIKKRFNKVKKIDIDKEKAEKYPLEELPVIIVDGDVFETGKGNIEIDFDNIKKQSDIMLDVENAEKEYVNVEGKSVYYIDKKEAIEKETIKLYYGCKYRLARLFDSFFHKKHERPKNLKAVYHLTDSQQ